MSTIELGDVTVARIAEMHGPIMPKEQFFPEMPEEAWTTHREMLVPDHLTSDDGMVNVAMQSWLLRSEGRTILIDTGVGNDKSRPAVEAWDHLSTGYLTALSEAGVSPDDVDVVVNTHLHVDHVGWNTQLVDGEWVPTFRNATYLMPKADFEFWNPENNPAITGGVNQNVYEDSVAPVYGAGQVELWDGSYAIDANLTLQAAPGHTPGSSVVRLESGSDRALFAGDLMHTPLQVLHPEHNSCFCEDPTQARSTRQRLLGWAADANALVLPAHFSGHSALEIGRLGDSFTVQSWASYPKH
jgi:glyoxylase-like metal-dependent hydrolase (beta-lactamase superfamily II)